MLRNSIQVCSRIKGLLSLAAGTYYVGPSKVQGNGVFASENIRAGELIGVVLVRDTSDYYKTKFKRTELAIYINHATDAANTDFVQMGSDYFLRTLRDVKAGEEFLTNYKHYESQMMREWVAGNKPVEVM